MQWISRLEVLWWSLFAAGGTLAALLLPVHIFLNNVAAPLGWVSLRTDTYEMAASLLGNPLVKAYLIVLLALTMYHAVHRVRLLPEELLLPLPERAVGAFAYGLATAFAVTAIIIVIVAP